MKNKLGLNINSILLLMFGAMLLFWGVSGAIGTVRTGIPEDDENPDDGFLPYTIPLEEDLLNDGQSTLLGPPDQTVVAPDEVPENISNDVLGDGNEDVIDLLADQGKIVIPGRIVIPKIKLIAPVVEAGLKKTWMEAKQYEQWLAPDEFAVGWHFTSAKLGEVGNTVLNGHHNSHGKVFVDLVQLEPGDLISVYGEGNEFKYVVVNKMILPERKVSADVRLENARWIMPSMDERLTLVTCWPYESNTHRLVIVAKPYTAE